MLENLMIYFLYDLISEIPNFFYFKSKNKIQSRNKKNLPPYEKFQFVRLTERFFLIFFKCNYFCIIFA